VSDPLLLSTRFVSGLAIVLVAAVQRACCGLAGVRMDGRKEG